MKVTSMVVMQKAYLLAMINQETLKVEGVNIYSEENPTTFSPYVYACIFWVEAETFAKGRDFLLQVYPRNFPTLAAQCPLG